MADVSSTPRLMTAKAFAELIGYDPRTIRERLTSPGQLVRGRHYCQVPARRRLLFNWTNIAADMGLPDDQQKPGDLLGTEDLARLISYDPRTIRERLAQDGFLRPKVHIFYLPIPKARTMLYLRSAVLEAFGFDAAQQAAPSPATQPAPQPAPQAAPTPSLPSFSLPGPSDPNLLAHPEQDRAAATTSTATDFFAKAAEVYLSELPIHLRQSTLIAVQDIVRTGLRPFFDFTCSEIDLKDVSLLINSIEAQQGRPTANLAFRTLQAIFEVAARLWGVTSPIRHLVDPPRRPSRVRVLRVPDITRLVAVAPPSFRNYFITRIFLGLSNEEVHGLRGRALLLDTGQLRIDEICVGGEWQPLDDKRTRTIPLPRIVRQALLQQRASLCGAPNPNDLVFPDHKGRPIQSAQLHQDVFMPMLKAAGIPPMQLRELSNTAPYLWLSANHAPHEVAYWAGHAEAVSALISRFKSCTLLDEGYSNIDRLVACALSDDLRQHLDIPSYLPEAA